MFLELKMEALLQITLSFSIYLGSLLRSVARAIHTHCGIHVVFISWYWIVDFSISMDAETVIDAPLLDIYVFFLYHFGYHCLGASISEFHRIICCLPKMVSSFFSLSYGFHWKWLDRARTSSMADIENTNFHPNNQKRSIWCALWWKLFV